MTSLPPLTEPHIRLTPYPHLLLHPPNLDSLLPSAQLPVFQKTSAKTWSYLGRYQLLSTVPATSVQDHDKQAPGDGNRICVFAWSEAAEFERCPEEAVVEEKEEEEEEAVPLPQIVLPPTPPPVADDKVSGSMSSIQSAYFSKPPTAPIEMLTPKMEKEKVDVMGSYTDLSMVQSQYSDFSEGESDEEEEEGDGDSDRWSVLSTGPVDRQWTVVFEEKEEVV